MSYLTITEIKQANKEAGFYWFSPDTVRHFKSRVSSHVFYGPESDEYPQGTRMWIESTTTYDGVGRDIKIAVFDVANARIRWASKGYETLHFSSKNAAVKYLKDNLQ